MKKLILMLVFAVAAGAVQAQVENPGDAAKSGATDHVNNNIQNGVDNTLNSTESAIKGIFKKKKKPAPNNQTNASQQQANNTATATSADGGSTATIAAYRNYDFVPGDKVIFQSQLTDEQVGEIPSQMTMESGQMDIQMMDNEKTIRVAKGAGATFAARMTNTTYLPDQFTVEFDVKNELFGINHLTVKFGANGDGIIKEVVLSNGGLSWSTGDVDFPEQLEHDKPMTWHHVAIAVNKNAGKVYMDQFRVANVNNLMGKVSGVYFEVNGYENSYIKNIRIAAGGINIYKAVSTDAKIVTHGILFDVNKASIRPESMGTINSIYDLLKNTPTLKFEIDGHTDNSGTPAGNLTLSQQRADAVKTQLVSMGIDASRLTTRGFGDTKPMANNTTPEGMANNRRVEFVKM